MSQTTNSQTGTETETNRKTPEPAIKTEITIADILAKYPCSGYNENALKKLFGDLQTCTPMQILECDQVPEQDRLWILLRINCVSQKRLKLFACDAAEYVLWIFQKKYPNDHGPSAAIMAARAYIDNKISLEELIQKRRAAYTAYAAAAAAADAADAYTAYAAAAAAATAAAAADAYADDAADDADAAAAAADAADDAADDARKLCRQWQLDRFKFYLLEQIAENELTGKTENNNKVNNNE